MAMSRSVIMPTRRSLSPTGIAPASISAMIFATSRMLCPGLATRTSRVIASLTRIGSPSVGLLPPGTKQEIDRHGDRANRHCNRAAHGERGRGNDEDALLRRSGFGGRDGEEQRCRDEEQIGRASCRERVWISGGGGAVNKKVR